MASKTGGGPGTNQYKVRGRTKARPPTGPGTDLMPPTNPGQHKCGELWGGDCEIRVCAPKWVHDGHPVTQKAAAYAATSRHTPPEVLVHLLRTHSTLEVWKLVGRNPALPKEEILKLAEDRSWVLRQSVAMNPGTPPEILARLAENVDWEMQSALARNPNVPPETLAKLANHTYWAARWFVAKNPSTPPETLARLAEDKAAEVREMVARNERTTPEALTNLALNDEDPRPREAAYENPSLPEHIRAIIALAGGPNDG